MVAYQCLKTHRDHDVPQTAEDNKCPSQNPPAGWCVTRTNPDHSDETMLDGLVMFGRTGWIVVREKWLVCLIPCVKVTVDRKTFFHLPVCTRSP